MAQPSSDGHAYERPEHTHDAELTEVGRGTPCGEFMRRYWQPVAVSISVTATPQDVRILGEDLILFRDGKGRPGLLTPRCVHRGTSLYYGKVDEDGIRCCYHGWQFDVEGRCIDQPCEPNNGAAHRHRIRQPWYPVEERYGLVFAYMGPPAKKPLLPRWDALEGLAPDETIFATDSSFSVGGDDSIKISAMELAAGLGEQHRSLARLYPAHSFQRVAVRSRDGGSAAGRVGVQRAGRALRRVPQARRRP